MNYKQLTGIVLDNNFITKEQFTPILKAALQNSGAYEDFSWRLAEINKIITIIESNNRVRSTVEFTEDLERIKQMFSSLIFKGLGGNISLLTTFNIGSKKGQTTMYHLMNEDDLPSRQTAFGEKQYLNTQKNLNALQSEGKDLVQLNQALVSHFNGFYAQLRNTKTQSLGDYISLKCWAEKNLANRAAIFQDSPQVSLGTYFWGKGHIHGYAAEAFGTHLALVHPDALMGSHIANLKRSSVITEHGGPGSEELFLLLASTKGNTPSWAGGDIIVIDQNGSVQFNIQSKASKRGAYTFTLKYRQLIDSIYLYKSIYEKYVNSSKSIDQKDIDALFNALSTKAWVKVKKDTEQCINEEIPKLAEPLCI